MKYSALECLLLRDPNSVRRLEKPVENFLKPFPRDNEEAEDVSRWANNAAVYILTEWEKDGYHRKVRILAIVSALRSRYQLSKDNGATEGVARKIAEERVHYHGPVGLS